MLHVESKHNAAHLTTFVEMLSQRLTNLKILSQSYLDKDVHAHSGFNQVFHIACSNGTTILLMDVRGKKTLLQRMFDMTTAGVIEHV